MKDNQIDVNAVLDRIREVLNLKNDVELAEKLGVIPSVVSNWRRRNAMKFDSLLVICEQKGINIRWVIFGKGYKFITELPEGLRYFNFVKLFVEEREVEQYKYDFTPYKTADSYPYIKTLSFMPQIKTKKIFSKIVLDETRHLGINLKDKDYPPNCLIYEVEEDGMSPGIRVGDYVLFECYVKEIVRDILDLSQDNINAIEQGVKKEENTFAGQIQATPNDIFLIKHNELNRLFLRRGISLSDSITDFVPDNYQYPSFKSHQVEVIGRVIEVIKRVKV